MEKGKKKGALTPEQAKKRRTLMANLRKQAAPGSQVLAEHMRGNAAKKLAAMEKDKSLYTDRQATNAASNKGGGLAKGARFDGSGGVGKGVSFGEGWSPK